MTARARRRLRGVAAISLAATAGLLGTYVGHQRTPRAYAQPGAPFGAFFAPSDVGTEFRAEGDLHGVVTGDGPPRSQVAAVPGVVIKGRRAPACTVSVDSAAALQAAVNGAADQEVICVTGDIDDLNEPLVIIDTTVTIAGAAGPTGEDPVTLVAGDNRHIDARFTRDGGLYLINMALAGGDAGAGAGGSVRFRGPGSGTGRALLAFGDMSFVDNSAFRGGAIHAVGASTLYGVDSELEGNRATNAGGAIYARNVDLVVGDGLRLDGNDGGTQGGALAVDVDAVDTRVVLSRSTLSRNTASVIGGAVSIVAEGRNAVLEGLGQIDRPLVFTRNSAGSGGAIWLEEAGIGEAGIVLRGSVEVSRNRATGGDGGGVNLSTDAPSTGPALLTQGDATLGSPTFTRNRATGDGGAAWVQGSAYVGGLGGQVDPRVDLTTVGGSFTRNQATNGGAISAAGIVTTLRAVFERNTAKQSGGAIDGQGANFTYAVYSQFRNNRARGGDGGAIYIDSEAPLSSVVGSCTFVGNRATDNGGAIAVQGGGGLVLVQGTLVRNEAKESAGAVYVADGLEARISFSTLTVNSAPIAGGVIAQAPVIENSVVQRNRSTGGDASADVLAESVTDSYSLFTSDSSVTSVLTPGGWLPGTGTVMTTWPVVGALSDNGGPAFPGAQRLLTMAPLNGSPVVESGTAGLTRPPNDERGAGFPRVIGARPDMGAIEWSIQEEFLGITGARGKGKKANRVTFRGRLSGAYLGTVTLNVRIGRAAAQDVEIPVGDGGTIRWSTSTSKRVTVVAKAAGMESPPAIVPRLR